MINVSKHGIKSNQNFEEHKKLVDKCIEKFDLDVCVVCKITPLKDAVQNNKKNELINEINMLLHDCYADNSSVIFLSLNAKIKGAEINLSDEHHDKIWG